MSNRTGAASLWTVEVKSGKTVGQPDKLMDGLQSAQLTDWVKPGIFFGQTTNTSDVYTVAIDAEGRTTDGPRQIPYPRTGRNISPVWSPDGERLAFVSSSAAEPNRRYVVVMPADGGQTREFLIPTSAYQGPQSPYDLRWFGDGRGLGFSGLDARGGKVVFRLPLETGEWELIQLPVKAAWSRIEWNRDGSSFYFVRHSWAEENAGIFERKVNAEDERLVYRLADKDAGIRALNFSHDRAWLAFQQNTGVGNDKMITRIIIVNVATGEARTLLEKTTDSGDLNLTMNLLGWSPSAELLVWRPGTGDAAADWLLVPVKSGEPRAMPIPTFNPPAPLAKTRPFVARLSPDGRSMVLVRESRGFQTFVIENPLGALRATTGSR